MAISRFVKKCIFGFGVWLMVGLILLVTILLCITGCETSLYNKVAKIQPDVQYDMFAYLSDEYVKIIDGKRTTVNIEKLAKKKLCKSSVKRLGSWTFDDEIYVTYQYKTHGQKDYNYEHPHNGRTYDVALMKFNTNTDDCKIVEKFTGLLPTGLYSDAPSFLYKIEGKLFLLMLNGKFYTYDLSSTEKTLVLDGYDATQYTNSQSMLPYKVLDNRDFYVRVGTDVKYCSYDNGNYTISSYTIAPASYYVDVYGDYMITSNYTNCTIYYDAFYLPTGEPVDVDTALENTKPFRSKSTETPNTTITVSGKEYVVENIEVNYGDRVGLTLTHGDEVITLDKELLLTNEKTQLLANSFRFSANESLIALPYAVIVHDDRIFVFCCTHGGIGRYTPTYLYEYDLENNKVYYVTYFESVNGFTNVKFI